MYLASSGRSAPTGPRVRSGGHAEEFLAGQRVVAEAAQHAAGDQVGAGLVHAAGSHAMMHRLDDHADALRLEDVIYGIGNLRRHYFPDGKNVIQQQAFLVWCVENVDLQLFADLVLLVTHVRISATGLNHPVVAVYMFIARNSAMLHSVA